LHELWDIVLYSNLSILRKICPKIGLIAELKAKARFTRR